MDPTTGPRGQTGGGIKPTRPSKPARPNYNAIHAQPLPLKIYPLPPLVPHNPVSLLHIVYLYLSQWLFPPSSHPAEKYQCYFSPETRSVHVTDEKAIRALWESGFFGKGSLSRSEPSWLDREKRRKGIIVGETSEEIRERRRGERKEFKKERARRELEAIEEKLKLERGNKAVDKRDPVEIGESKTLRELSHEEDGVPANGHIGHEKTPSSPLETERTEEITKVDLEDSAPGSTARITSVAAETPSNPNAFESIENKEHLQLTLEEAFFLAYGLGVLSILDADSAPIPTAKLFSLFRQNSYFPPRPVSALRPDDPFLTSYIVYHHFRSLGWVVRPGVKFAVDYLLYNRGPAFSHAEFAVVIVPSYSHPYWRDSEERAAQTKKKESKSWWWLHCVNRVQSQVRKSLVLIFVEIAPPEAGDEECRDIGALIKRYQVRELTLRRWIPNRSRD